MEEKIVSALAKLSETFRFLLWKTGKEDGLSPIQIKFLIFLNNHSKEFRKTSQLALEFNLTNATVSEAVSMLVQKNLVYKTPSIKDRRVSTLSLSSIGREKIKKMSHWAESIQEYLTGCSTSDKKTTMLFLMNLIGFLRSSGVVSAARMCIICDNFQKDFKPGEEKPHYCRLTGKMIADSELNIDCEGFKSNTKKDCEAVLV